MAKMLDNGVLHEQKIKEMDLSCPPLSGYNHLAVFLKWAYNRGFVKAEVLSSEPLLEPAMRGEGDLREVLANSEYLKGRLLPAYFTDECRAFAEWFYDFEADYSYPLSVDKVAEEYLGEKYNSPEIKNEGYLFVPYNDEYYKNLSRFIDEAWEKRPPYSKKPSTSYKQFMAACVNMTDWLADPHELGKKPRGLSCETKFLYNDMTYYGFKFKKGLFGGWLLGVAGGFEGDDVEPCGHTYSEYKPFNKDTAKDDCIAMIEKIMNYWKEQAKNFEQ